MRIKNFYIGRLKEKPDRDTAEASDSRTAQMVNLEEQVNERTKDLEAAEQQLKELSQTTNTSGEDKDAPIQPHGPVSELSVEPEGELLDEETDASTLLEEAGEEVQVVKIEAKKEAEATAAVEAEKEPTIGEADDSLASLFGQEDDAVNPLANLINSLPNVTAQELLVDLGEIKEIIREWRQS